MLCKAVSQLDEHDANIVDHGQHHFAEVFRLLFFACNEINGADLGNAFDDMGNLLAKFLADIDDCDGGVFNGIVEKAGGDGDRVHLHFGENQGDFEGMDQVGFAGGPALSGVVFLGKLVGLANKFEVIVGPVGPHPAHQLTKLGYREDIGRELLAQGRHA